MSIFTRLGAAWKVLRAQESNLFNSDLASGGDGFRRVGTARRDMFEDRYTDLQTRAYHFYRVSPLAYRGTEIYASFVVGQGFSFKAEDPRVDGVLTEFWKDPANDWESRQHNYVRELSVYGEQHWPVHVDQSGRVVLSYIDPLDVTKILANPLNPTHLMNLVIEKPGGKPVTLRIISAGRDGRLQGEVFSFSINRVTNATRGQPDLLPAIDWIDRHEGFLISIDEAARVKTAIATVISMEGGTPQDYLDAKKEFQDLEPGSVKFLNNLVKIENTSANLQTGDMTDQARILKRMVSAALGIPDHWLSEGSETNVATAKAMGVPTVLMFRERQKVWKTIIAKVFDFVIDQAILHHRLPRDVDRGFEVIAPNVWSDDTMTISNALSALANAMTLMLQEQLIEVDDARSLLKFVTAQLGFGDMAFGAKQTGTTAVDTEPKAVDTAGAQARQLNRMKDLTQEIDAGMKQKNGRGQDGIS